MRLHDPLGVRPIQPDLMFFVALALGPPLMKATSISMVLSEESLGPEVGGVKTAGPTSASKAGLGDQGGGGGQPLCHPDSRPENHTKAVGADVWSFPFQHKTLLEVISEHRPANSVGLNPAPNRSQSPIRLGLIWISFGSELGLSWLFYRVKLSQTQPKFQPPKHFRAIFKLTTSRNFHQS